MLYHSIMKQTLENTENLQVIQAEIVSVDVRDGKICGVITKLGAYYETKAAIICSGTYLEGRVIVGDTAYSSGPDGMLPSSGLNHCLEELGIKLMRFKTGTPPRIHRSSIDFSKLERQDGETDIIPYSYKTDAQKLNSAPQTPCYIAYTNEKTHEIIRANLHRSPLYSGVIKGTGPRYCPSIEVHKTYERV